MKYFISTVVGLLTAIVCISLLEYLIIFLCPLPAGIDMQDLDSISANMENIPLINLILIIVSYGIASLLAGFVSVKIKTPNPRGPIIIIGVVLTILGFINFLTIPYPLWMLVVSSIIFIPMTYLGGKIGTPQVTYESIYKL